MTTRGFDAEKKAAVERKIREMDDKLDEAKAAMAAGDEKRARELLREFEDMKVQELITIFPEIAMAERHHDIPFSVLYEMFAEFWDTVFGFLRWLAKELRKPKDQRDLSARRAWVIRLRRLLGEFEYLTQLRWPPDSPGRALLDELIAKLRAIIARMEGLTDENAGQVQIDEIDSVEFGRLLNRFLESLGDPTFNISSVCWALKYMDDRARQASEKLLETPDPDETAEDRRRRFEGAIETIEGYKHRIGEVVDGTPTVPSPPPAGEDGDQDGTGSGDDGGSEGGSGTGGDSGGGGDSDDGESDGGDGHGGLPPPDWQDHEPAYLAAALDWVRTAVLAGKGAPTICEAARAVEASEHALASYFRTDADMLVAALAPNGAAPPSLYPLSDDDEPSSAEAGELTESQIAERDRLRAFLEAAVPPSLRQAMPPADLTGRGNAPPDAALSATGNPGARREGE